MDDKAVPMRDCKTPVGGCASCFLPGATENYPGNGAWADMRRLDAVNWRALLDGKTYQPSHTRPLLPWPTGDPGPEREPLERPYLPEPICPIEFDNAEIGTQKLILLNIPGTGRIWTGAIKVEGNQWVVASRGGYVPSHTLPAPPLPTGFQRSDLIERKDSNP